ncbi:MAG: cbb3-type cytochrome c oxidase N-terminal domain-containing protein [Bacteroidota bacterium]
MTYKKTVLFLFVILFSIRVWARVDEAPAFDILDWAVEHVVLLMGSAAIIGASLGLYRSLESIWRIQKIADLESGGMPREKAIRQMSQQSFSGYIYRELAGGVPLDQEADILLSHDYDGVRELDNNLPPWWVGMFYATILFAGVYMVVYHVSDIGMSNIEAYEKEVRDAEIAIAAYNLKMAEEKAKAEKSEVISAETIAVLTDADQIAAGKETFDTYCVACHGKYGEGMEGLGQNLTDEYWIHGGGIKNIYKTISDGVPGKTMVAWKATLKPKEIQQVSSYILTLQGTNPPNAREAEGDLWDEDERQPLGLNSSAKTEQLKQ